MKRTLLLAAVIGALLATGCAHTNRQATPVAKNSRTVALAVTVNGYAQPTNQQWAVISSTVGRQLAARGYTIVNDLALADQIIRVDFTPDPTDPENSGQAVILGTRPNPRNVATTYSPSPAYSYMGGFGSSYYHSAYGYGNYFDRYYYNDYYDPSYWSGSLVTGTTPSTKPATGNPSGTNTDRTAVASHSGWAHGPVTTRPRQPLDTDTSVAGIPASSSGSSTYASSSNASNAGSSSPHHSFWGAVFGHSSDSSHGSSDHGSYDRGSHSWSRSSSDSSSSSYSSSSSSYSGGGSSSYSSGGGGSSYSSSDSGGSSFSGGGSSYSGGGGSGGGGSSGGSVGNARQN